MKQLIFFLIGIMLFNACKPCKEPAQKEFRILSDPISVDATSRMVSKLLTDHPSLRRIAREKAFGGYFPASDFNDTTNYGVLLWHCYNIQKEQGYPEFFFALEWIKAYDVDNPPKEPINKDLKIPLGTFTYGLGKYDTTTVQGFIVGHETRTQSASTSISKELVMKYSKNFEELMKWIPLQQDTLYCKYPHAFFLRDSSYANFMGRKPHYVRYYMGLKVDKDHYPNYFRPILAPVDINGKTIIKKTRGDMPFLQKSWPPPPNNRK